MKRRENSQFDYEEARRRVEELTGKPTYFEVEDGVEETGSEIEKVDKDYQKVELHMKANPQEGVTSTLRLTKKDEIFEEKIRYPRSSKTEEPKNRFEEIEDSKEEENFGELEKKKLELDKKERQAKAKRQAALIDAEKAKHEVEEAQKAKEKAELELKQEQRPQVHFPRKE